MILRPIYIRPLKGPILRQFPLRQSPLAYRSFHASSLRCQAGLPDHYATLGIDATASAGDVKKQFFQLSKKTPPRSQPQRPNSRRPLRQNLRSLQRPRQCRQTSNLRPRLPPCLTIILPPPPSRLTPQFRSCRRPSSHGTKSTTHTIQRPASFLLPQWRLGQFQSKAIGLCFAGIASV